MTDRTQLSVDSRGRISVQKLGFEPSSTLVAERLPDGGVVIRNGTVLTDAELDFLSSPSALEGLKKGLADAEAERFGPKRRSG